METQQQQLEALNDIRQMMRQSSKFLSLSGLSGIFAGIYALAGAYAGVMVIESYADGGDYSERAYERMLMKCVVVCAVVLLMSILTALVFSFRKAKKRGETLFDHTALRLMVNIGIPLVSGGIFCMALLFHGSTMILMICPAMLIFYGLALVNGSKYTLPDIRYLGCCEIALGMIAAFYPGYGIIFWAIGFGLLHIVYGAYMWYKYDRKY